MANSDLLLRGRLKGYQRMQLSNLLNMLYTPSELAKELGFTTRQVYRVYLSAGCPHTRDGRRHIWINGKHFAEWYEATYPKQTLADNQAFCLTCKKAVVMRNPVQHRKGRLVYAVCNCSNCGRRLARIISKDKRGK